MNSLKKTSFAKINLYLKLTGKRPNGYHELESLFAFLDLHDELEVSLSDKLSLEIAGEFAPALVVQENILVKILDFFATNYKISRHLKIKLTKNIPLGAGLGGGSSNGAYFMKILNELFALNLSKEELQKISINFGSDLAFFFEDRASIIKGCGEIILPYPTFEPILAILINPKINLATKQVFEKFNDEFSKQNTIAELQKTPVLDLIKNFPNDLTKPAISIVPVIAEILDELKNETAKMSGSGASCFAIFENSEAQNSAFINLQKKFPHFFVRKVKILSHV